MNNVPAERIAETISRLSAIRPKLPAGTVERYDLEQSITELARFSRVYFPTKQGSE